MEDGLRDVLEAGDPDRLRAHLSTHPEAVASVVHWGPDGKNESSPLHYVAALRFHGLARDADTGALTLVLLDAGADPESRHSKPGGGGETVLQTAVSLWDRAVVGVLLEAGVDLEARGGIVDDGTALTLAVHFAAPAIADRLVGHGAEVNTAELAAGVGDVVRMRTLRTADTRGDRALLYAAINSRIAALEEAIAWGADPLAPLDGATLLHWCVWWGATESVRDLLARGADPARRDPEHDLTPLGWAEFRSQEAVRNGWEMAERLEAIRDLLRPVTPDA